MPGRGARAWLTPAVVAAVFIVDRLSKAWALGSLRPRGAIVLSPFFHLTYVENTGAAWGSFQGRNMPLVILSIALLGGLLYLRRRWPKEDGWLQGGAALVLGGALGNLYDRLAFGFVVDFLDFRVWPVFNAADAAISVGACCLAWGMRSSKPAA